MGVHSLQLIHVCRPAVEGCPRPDLCYGQVCVAPDICHNPEIQANRRRWKWWLTHRFGPPERPPGRCIRCGAVLEDRRKRLCEECRAKRCRYCSAPAEPGHRLCERHLRYMREHTRAYNRAKRRRCKEMGICTVCMKRPATHGAMCERCHGYQAARRAKAAA